MIALKINPINMIFKPVVRNIKTQDIYFYNGENEFENLRTGIKGKISDKAAQNTFKISAELSILLNDYPMIAELIKRADLTTEMI